MHAPGGWHFQESPHVPHCSSFRCLVAQSCWKHSPTLQTCIVQLPPNRNYTLSIAPFMYVMAYDTLSAHSGGTLQQLCISSSVLKDDCRPKQQFVCLFGQEQSSSFHSPLTARKKQAGLSAWELNSPLKPGRTEREGERERERYRESERERERYFGSSVRTFVLGAVHPSWHWGGGTGLT